MLLRRVGLGLALAAVLLVSGCRHRDCCGPTTSARPCCPQPVRVPGNAIAPPGPVIGPPGTTTFRPGVIGQEVPPCR